MSSLEQEQFDTAIKLRDRERTRRRYFITTVAVMVAAWCVAVAAAWVCNSIFLDVMSGETTFILMLSTGLTAISNGIIVAAALQIAVWWQWPVPHRSSWKWFAVLVGCYVVANLYPYMDTDIWEMFGERWFFLLALTMAFYLMVIPLYLLGMRIPGRLWQFRLLDSLDEELQGKQFPPPNQHWSIAGFIFLTLLVALMLALYQGMRKLFETEIGGTVTVYYPPNDLVMMVYHGVNIGVDLIVLWAAALSSLSRHRGAIALVLLSVTLSVVAELAYMWIMTDRQSFVDMDWFESIIRHTFEGVTSYFVLRWCFRRWRIAGFEMRGWVQRRELAPR